MSILQKVAPLVGAWIEIKDSVEYLGTVGVAPLVGAWIEIHYCYCCCTDIIVAPLVGAWIEITVDSYENYIERSLLSWERGLKSRGKPE